MMHHEIQRRLNYWKKRQAEIEAERPQSARAELEQRFAIRVCAEERIKAEIALRKAEQVAEVAHAC